MDTLVIKPIDNFRRRQPYRSYITRLMKNQHAQL